MSKSHFQSEMERKGVLLLVLLVGVVVPCFPLLKVDAEDSALTDPKSFSVLQRNELEERLSSFSSKLESSYVYRMRPDSFGTGLFVHCLPRDGGSGGHLVLLRDDDIRLLNSDLPAQNVWWDNLGNIVAYSEETPYCAKVVGNKNVLKGPHTVQIRGAEFTFGGAEQSTLFDMSEDGNWVYVFKISETSAKSSHSEEASVSLSIADSQQPKRVLFEAHYPTIPIVYLRGETLHIFSDVNKKYACRKFLHEKLQVRGGEMTLDEGVRVSAKRILFSSRYSINMLSSDARLLFVTCAVDMPFGAKSHVQQIPLDGSRSAEILFSLQKGLTIVPVALRW